MQSHVLSALQHTHRDALACLQSNHTTSTKDMRLGSLLRAAAARSSSRLSKPDSFQHIFCAAAKSASAHPCGTRRASRKLTRSSTLPTLSRYTTCSPHHSKE